MNIRELKKGIKVNGKYYFKVNSDINQVFIYNSLKEFSLTPLNEKYTLIKGIYEYFQESWDEFNPDLIEEKRTYIISSDGCLYR